MYEDTPLLVTFFIGHELVGETDGLPTWRNVVMIRKMKWPQTQVEYVATDEHIQEYPDAWEMFKREQKGNHTPPYEGYPLVFWPAVDPAERQACFYHEIYTVERLASIPANSNFPASIVELAMRAKRMVRLARDVASVEVKMATLEGEIQALKEHNQVLLSINADLRREVGQLQTRMAPVMPMFPFNGVAAT